MHTCRDIYKYIENNYHRAQLHLLASYSLFKTQQLRKVEGFCNRSMLVVKSKAWRKQQHRYNNNDNNTYHNVIALAIASRDFIY